LGWSQYLPLPNPLSTHPVDFLLNKTSIQGHIRGFAKNSFSSNCNCLRAFDPIRWGHKNNITPIDLIPEICNWIGGFD
jgi:hypothetical protein